MLVRRPNAVGARTVPVAAGILPDALANICVLDYGDVRALEFIAEHAHELAAVLVEPVQSRNPELQPGDFLQQLRQLTQDRGVALIFDEIITGFRCHPGGAQAHFGVKATPRSTARFGGGMPIGVVAGSARFLDALDGGDWRYGDASGPERAMTYFAGTFVRHPLAIAAADAVLRRLEADGPTLQEMLNERTANLARTLSQQLADSGLSMRLGHFASMFFLRPTHPESLESLLFYHLRARGIHLWEGRPGFLSTAHTDQDLAAIERRLRGESRRAERQNRRARALAAERSGYVAVPMTPTQADLWIAARMTRRFPELQPLLRRSSAWSADAHGATRGVAGPGRSPRGPANDLRRRRTLPVHLGPHGDGRAGAGCLAPAAVGRESRARGGGRRGRGAAFRL